MGFAAARPVARRSRHVLRTPDERGSGSTARLRAFGFGLDPRQRHLHAALEIGLEPGVAAEEHPYKGLRQLGRAVRCRAPLRDPRARLGWFELVRPHRLVLEDAECDPLLRDEVDDLGARGPHGHPLAVEVERPGTHAYVPEHEHLAALRAPLAHPREVGDDRPHPFDRRIDLCRQLEYVAERRVGHCSPRLRGGYRCTHILPVSESYGKRDIRHTMGAILLTERKSAFSRTEAAEGRFVRHFIVLESLIELYSLLVYIGTVFSSPLDRHLYITNTT